MRLLIEEKTCRPQNFVIILIHVHVHAVIPGVKVSAERFTIPPVNDIHTYVYYCNLS